MTHITDHAVLRYLERVYGLDVEKVKQDMQSPGLERAAEFGCPVVIGRRGERLIIRGGMVVTVIAKAKNVGRTINHG